MELARRGVGRQQAHEIMRRASMRAFEEGRDLSEILIGDDLVSSHLSEEEIRMLLDPHRYIGTAVSQVERLNEKLRRLCTS
ncbi:MAG: hypothetical protein QUS08_00560 [Methanothrix sp.]|nr:hypothetical protein [Methanothrix sp.]